MQTLQDFTLDQLRELYNAEIQLKIILEKIAYHTGSEALRHTFEKLSKDMDLRTQKLEDLFSLPDTGDHRQRHSHVMEGIGRELQAFLESQPSQTVADAGFIAILQKAKHYQIALYGTLKEFAHTLGNANAEKILADLLETEKQTDRNFSEKARDGINDRALLSDSGTNDGSSASAER